MTTVRAVTFDWTAWTPVHGPVARYRQLAAWLRGAIDRGELSGALPSETAIADYTGVSVDTVRSALAELRESGHIVTSQGIGSFTAGKPRDE